MPGYDDLNKYIEQNEHTISLYSINQSNLKRNIYLNTNKSNNESIIHIDNALSITDQLDFCIQKLKQNQVLRSNQLKKIHQLFELDINIDDELNLDINSIQDESRRYEDYDFEAFLVGKHLDSNINHESTIISNNDNHMSNHINNNDTMNNIVIDDINNTCDIPDIFVKDLDISRVNRRNKLRYIAQCLSNLNHLDNKSESSNIVISNINKPTNNSFNSEEIYHSNKLSHENPSLNHKNTNEINRILPNERNESLSPIIFNPTFTLSPNTSKKYTTLEAIADNISEW